MKTVENKFLESHADPVREIRLDLDADWDGEIPIRAKEVDGARVRLMIYVPEAAAGRVDRVGIRASTLKMGALYCKVDVYVLRSAVKRDPRHRDELSIEESLRIFGEETRPAGVEKRIEFAAALAREADAGVRE